MTNNIKPGFLLRVESWENDGDNCQTHQRAGLTRKDVAFLLDYLEVFDHNGNDFLELSFIEKVLREKLEKHPDISDDVKKFASITTEIIDIFLGSPSEGYWDCSDEQVFVRAYAGATVYLVEKEIPDVTDQF